MPPVSLVGLDVIAEMCALAKSTPPGCIVEVGVYKGGTAWHLSQLGRRLYLYDTFTGIPYADPERGDAHKIGDFADTSAISVSAAVPHAIVVEGVFPHSAIEMDPVAFVHLDVDQYQSYKDAINYLRPRMVDGGIMWFDDGCLPGCLLALKEEFGNELVESACHKHYAVIKGNSSGLVSRESSV